jgi:Cu-processing system ATP-binding protein
MILIEHLTKKYGTAVGVDGVSLYVKEGEVFAFLGPNGSGKTTTLRSIVGLHVPTGGRVQVDGLDVRRYPKETRRMISYLPQRVVFPEAMTAREILEFYARLRKLPTSRVDETINRARFNGFSGKVAGEYSGGMIQRLGLALVSLADAPILLLDEPTANLDPEGVKRFREFVLQQREAGKTIIFSTHLLPEAEQLADRVAIFVTGKLVALESVESLQETYLQTKTIEDLYLHYVGTRQPGD